jgi:hypothetical protein
MATNELSLRDCFYSCLQHLLQVKTLATCRKALTRHLIAAYKGCGSKEPIPAHCNKK